MPKFQTAAEWRAWVEANGYWTEHPDYPVSDWQYEVANDDTRQGYVDWVMSKFEIPDPLVIGPQTPPPPPAPDLRLVRDFEVVVFEVVKLKVTGLRCTSYAEAAQQAEEIVGHERDDLFQRKQPRPNIDYIEPGEETAYFLVDLMDGKDILASRWLSGTQKLDGDTPTPEEQAKRPFEPLPPAPRKPAPVGPEPTWDADPSGRGVLKGHG